MKKIILILLISVKCFGQIPDNVLHHYAGVSIAVSTGWFVYKITKGKRFPAVTIGCATGVTAGILKEEIWDRKWRRGIPDNLDKINTAWGAVCGSVYLGVGLHIHERKIHPERYQNLNL